MNVAGDPNDPNGPTYSSFTDTVYLQAQPIGTILNQRISRSGQVNVDPSLAGHGVSIGMVDNVTNHGIASPFWNFMNSSGTVYESGQYIFDTMFESPYFATGRPISEPYWANVLVGGTPKLVLIQCFERRCLTYTLANAVLWQVEMGNIGQHYYVWRYQPLDPQPLDPQPPDPQPTTPKAPTNLVASQFNESTAELNWTDNSNNDNGFNVYMEKDFAPRQFIGTVDCNGAQLCENGFVIDLTPNTHYCFYVAAFNANGESSLSNSSCLTTASSGTVPNNPTSLEVSQYDPNTAQLFWIDLSNNEDGFNVYMEEAFGAAQYIGSLTCEGAQPCESGFVINLQTGVHYCFFVAAFNIYGESGLSNGACLTLTLSIDSVNNSVESQNGTITIAEKPRVFGHYFGTAVI